MKDNRPPSRRNQRSFEVQRNAAGGVINTGAGEKEAFDRVYDHFYPNLEAKRAEEARRRGIDFKARDRLAKQEQDILIAARREEEDKLAKRKLEREKHGSGMGIYEESSHIRRGREEEESKRKKNLEEERLGVLHPEKDQKIRPKSSRQNTEGKPLPRLHSSLVMPSTVDMYGSTLSAMTNVRSEYQQKVQGRPSTAPSLDNESLRIGFQDSLTLGDEADLKSSSSVKKLSGNHSGGGRGGSKK